MVGKKTGILHSQDKKTVRTVAILAAYNEERFIAGCLEHLFEQGVEVYLIDNCSTDRTAEIAESYKGRGLLGIETHSRGEGVYRWRSILERKEELAATFKADWIMHVDADEILLPPHQGQTLVEAFAEVEEAGYNVVDFQEFTFVPTRESPDHEHPEYQETMRWYYPFSPSSPRLMRAWQQQDVTVGLSKFGGHKVDFPGMKLWPEKFPMKHYLFLSVDHILEKYGARNFDRAELKRGWHGWRARLKGSKIRLPLKQELRFYGQDGCLDASKPRKRHITEEWTTQTTRLREWVMQKVRLLGSRKGDE